MGKVTTTFAKEIDAILSFSCRQNHRHISKKAKSKVFAQSRTNIFEEASFVGTVRIVEYETRGYGHYIVIRHNNGLETLYAHLSKPLVRVNQEVTAGQLIGLGGSTGRSTGPHLHFEFRFLGNAFNTGKIIDYSTERCFADSYCITKSETFRHKADVERFNQMKYHRVRQGETLSYIAKRYGTTVKRICHWDLVADRRR